MDSPENPITDAGPVIDASPVTETPVANNADIVAPPQPAQRRQGARRTARRLYIQASSPADQELDEALGRIRYHGALRREVGDWDELDRMLRRFGQIDTLVLMTHSAPGTLLIGGEARSGPDAAAVLRGTGARATTMIFEGCMIMREPVEAAQIAQGLGATTAVGYDWWHYMGKRVWGLDQSPADEVFRQDVTAWAEDIAKYLMQPRGSGPRQPATGAAIVARLERDAPSQLTLYLEWFHPSAGAPATPNPVVHPARRDLRRRQLNSRQQADEFRAIDHAALDLPHEVTLAVRRILR
jgi:hypothetical protein